MAVIKTGSHRPSAPAALANGAENSFFEASFISARGSDRRPCRTPHQKPTFRSRQIERFAAPKLAPAKLSFSLRNYRGLPRDGFPLAAAFDESAGIKIFLHRRFAVRPFGRGDKSKRDHCRIAELKNFYILRRIGRYGVTGLARGRRKQSGHQILFTNSLPGGPRIDQFIAPKTVVNRRIIPPRALKEKIQQPC